jgi:hypothetical protein
VKWGFIADRAEWPAGDYNPHLIVSIDFAHSDRPPTFAALSGISSSLMKSMLRQIPVTNKRTISSNATNC